MATSKLSLPAFLKVLTNGNVTMPKAMVIASKLSGYKTCNTPAGLGQLTDMQLKGLGVEEKDERRQVLAAVKKAGYKAGPSAGTLAAASPSQSNAPASSSKSASTASPRKRKRNDDVNELLPTGPSDEGAEYQSLEFDEVLDEDVLKSKATVVNRAPIMTAWATVVAERMGFKREEALSIASAYTEMNAISKGVSIGVFEKGKGKGIELAKGESQPYVDLMGRRPVFSTQSSEWRALVKGAPIAPGAAYGYITRALRQTSPYVLGALRLLAASYTPAELNKHGFSLYADFRPAVDGWGKRTEMRCETILALRKQPRAEGGVEGQVEHTVDEVATVATVLKAVGEGGDEKGESEDPPNKKVKSLTLEEYEAMLDDDASYQNLSFDEVF